MCHLYKVHKKMSVIFPLTRCRKMRIQSYPQKSGVKRCEMELYTELFTLSTEKTAKFYRKKERLFCKIMIKLGDFGKRC